MHQKFLQQREGEGTGQKIEVIFSLLVDVILGLDVPSKPLATSGSKVDYSRLTFHLQITPTSDNEQLISIYNLKFAVFG